MKVPEIVKKLIYLFLGVPTGTKQAFFIKNSQVFAIQDPFLDGPSNTQGFRAEKVTLPRIQERIVLIGSEPFKVFDARPDDWSMENDYIHDIAQLDDDKYVNVFRVTSWMGRVMYIIESGGNTVKIPLKQAGAISRLIANDDAVKNLTC